jgi:hypothetical protein
MLVSTTLMTPITAIVMISTAPEASVDGLWCILALVVMLVVAFSVGQIRHVKRIPEVNG